MQQAENNYKNSTDPGAPCRVLVIDDDAAQRVLLSRTLGDAGYDVLLADDGLQGLEATRESAPDLVLCDWVMPRLDGLEYCRSVKSDPKLQSTYVAMLTARSDSGDRVMGLDAGADDFMTKPVHVDELLARVRAGLRIRRLQRDLSQAQHQAALLTMAVTLGHEINNPLTALYGHLELIQQYLDQGDHERIRHHISQSGVVGARIAEVVNRLIALRDPQFKPYLGNLESLDLESGNR